MLSSGSAPIAAEVLDFLKIAFGGHVIEGISVFLIHQLYLNAPTVPQATA